MRKFIINVNGKSYEVEVEEVGGAPIAAPVIKSAPTEAPKAPAAPKAAAPSGNEGSIKVTSPMPGTILRINANVGDKVTKGQPIVVLEAMKMENDIPAPCDGVIASVNVQKGASVNAGDLVASIN